MRQEVADGSDEAGPVGGGRPDRHGGAATVTRYSSYAARRSRVPAAVGGTVVVVAVIVWFAVSLASTAPPPRLTLLASSRRKVGGAPLVLSPSPGAEEAVAVRGVGTIAAAGGATPTPIGSLAKVMSALVVLRDHPLSTYGSGPDIPVTAADVATYNQELAQGDSVVAVQAGEQLSERQALEAALVPSGDNVVQLLATWDAGSTAAFVARMNALARSLGLSHTHYAGPSGVNPASTSTATDQLRLAEVAMGNPVLRHIVSLPQVTLPVAGVQYNVDADLGSDGIDGIKTGWVPQGGGCFVFAATAAVGGSPVSIVGAVLGDQGPQPIPDALALAKQIVVAAEGDLTTVRLPSGTPVATMHAPYGRPVPVVTGAPVTLVAWRGATLGVTMRPARSVDDTVPAGRDVGSVAFGVGGGGRRVPMRTAAALAGPSLGWRLLHP